MRGARLICLLPSPASQVPGTRQKVVVRSRLAAAVCEVQIACEVQRGEWGRSDLGEIVLADLGDEV